MEIEDHEKLTLYEFSDIITGMYARIIEIKRKKPFQNVSQSIELVGKLNRISNFYYTMFLDAKQHLAWRNLVEYENEQLREIIREQKKEILKLKNHEPVQINTIPD